jgi:hypothetical protein
VLRQLQRAEPLSVSLAGSRSERSGSSAPTGSPSGTPGRQHELHHAVVLIGPGLYVRRARDDRTGGRPEVGRICFVQDPDGDRIELIDRDFPTPQDPD